MNRGIRIYIIAAKNKRIAKRDGQGILSQPVTILNQLLIFVNSFGSKY
jgi:hypothetical protein